MKKEEFLNELRRKLSGLPKDDLDDRIMFYSEMIDDRISEGKTEEEAISDIGTTDEVCNEVLKDTSLVKIVKEKVTPKRSLRGWEIALIIIGSPLWFPLILVAFILVLVLYLLIWIFVGVTYILDLAFAIGSIGSLVGFFYYLFSGDFNLITLGAFIMCVGLTILMVFACIGASKGGASLSKAIFLGIKKSFMKKGNND